MKVKFGEDLSRKDSGKHKFLSRLAKEFKRLGVQIAGPGEKADVFLHICRNQQWGERCRVSVARMDGLILNSKANYTKQNKGLKRAIDKSTGVVYQGEFCREAYEKFLGVKKTNACILNGANPNEFGRRGNGNFFLANCKWRPHKRLPTIVKAFELANKKGLDADLVVLGVKKDMGFHTDVPRVDVKKWVDGNEAMSNMLSHAISTIHLSWLDWCPNAMVESAVAGCPVIYTDSGGSAQVGKGVGIPIKDTQWCFDLVDLYSPPDLDIEEIADAMIKIKKEGYEVDASHLNIEKTAKKYLDFFERLL